jgi:6-phosphogluconate dehydrogenase
MGQNLILNMADHGFTVIAFNRTVSKVDRFLENEAKGKSIIGAHSVEEFVQKLKKPRRMMMLVQAGHAVDDFIELIITSSSLLFPLPRGPLTFPSRRRSRAGRHHH